MPSNERTRPTSERFKESLFSVILPRIPGSVFLDAFAGSGQIGLEALSRGAAEVFFVEKDRRTLRALDENIARLKLTDAPEIHLYACRLEQALPRIEAGGSKIDLLYLDPPWQNEAVFQSLREHLVRGELMAKGAWIISESDAKNPCPLDAVLQDTAWRVSFERIYGSARLKIFAEED